MPAPAGDDLPADLRCFTCPPEVIANLEKLRPIATFDALCKEHDGPFIEWGSVRTFDQDGKQWHRRVASIRKYMIDIELSADGHMGVIRAVPPTDSYREHKARGWSV